MTIGFTASAAASSSLRALRYSSAQRTNSVGNLASGKKQNLSAEDGGAFSMASRIDASHRLEGSMTGNMQSLVSFSQTQDALLGNMASIVDRIGELATSASNAFLSDSDRNAYELEYQQMVKQFEATTQEVINEQKYFFSTFSEDKKDFIAGLKGGWLRAAEELIQDKYGITGDGDEFELIVNEDDTGTYAAYVLASSTGDVLKMVFDLPDFSPPHAFPSSDSPTYFTDRTVAHELVHAVQARNGYNGDLDGDGNLWAKLWFSEGIAEFVHGGDYRLSSAQQAGLSNQDIVMGTDSNHLYARYAVSAQYMHKLVKDLGRDVTAGGTTFRHSDGIKALIGWQSAQFKAGAGATNGGWSQAINAFLGHQGLTNETAFLNRFEANDANGGAAFISNHVNLGNTDTGAIGGKDSDNGSEISDQAAVPDIVNSPTGDPDQPLKHWKIVWEEDEGIKINTDSSGSSWEMDSIEPIQFGDTSIYNLSSTDSAALVVTRVQELLDSIATGRSKVGANLSRFNSSLERLQERKHASVESLERIQGANLAEESLSLTKSTIRLNFGMAILAQANLSPSTLMLLL